MLKVQNIISLKERRDKHKLQNSDVKDPNQDTIEGSKIIVTPHKEADKPIISAITPIITARKKLLKLHKRVPSDDLSSKLEDFI